MTLIEIATHVAAAQSERFDFTDPEHFTLLADRSFKVAKALQKKQDELSEAEEAESTRKYNEEQAALAKARELVAKEAGHA